ncbi:hypothetical protein SAMN06298215_0773 [Bacteroidales bacterium WCE2008]|nr:hypothetical protein SAMN06298215_0773 [Bacteroidales bacterium WCE2008]
MTINSMQEAFRLSDHEIEQFLKEYWGNEEFEFSGEYDGEKFTGIKSGDRLIKYPVNNNKPFIKIRSYRCESGKRYFFHCELAPRSFRESINNAFIINVIPNTIRPDTSVEIDNVKYRLRLENDFFIGQFIPDGPGSNWTITDIRDTDFTKVEDQERGVKDITIKFNARGLQGINRFAYYRFSWVLLNSSPLQFGIDLTKEIKPMYPEDIVRSLYSGIIRYSASASKKSTGFVDTLKKQLTQSGKEVFIYELLQNANDYPQRNRDRSIIPVDVEFHLTVQYLIFQHTGDYFNARNVAAICDINDGEKTENQEAIGYKGIGFKTVFADNDYVYLHTGSYSFNFYNDPKYPINTPWQILPVWTEAKSVYSTVQSIFERTPDDLFRVKFALMPRESKILTDRTRKDNYIDLFLKVFDTERVILFIPNIRKVSVYFGNKPTPDIVRSKENSNWCVSKAYTDDVPPFVRKKIDSSLSDTDAEKEDGYEKIPKKYLHFNKTTVKFACKREGRKLLPVEKANLYCYLPAKRANWGFDFLMNTDMLPNGARDDIEDIELNHEIAKIAGRQFFYWIKDLIASGEYELESIFSLIPDFDECKENHSDYETFIDEFQEEFESLIKSEPFVPVVNAEGESDYATIDDIINDRTGITANGVMADADFISLTATGCDYLPVQELRSSDSFGDFIYKHSPATNDVDFDSIRNVVSDEDFQTWLKVQDNNNKFLEHLLRKGELDSFAEQLIFIEYEGELFKADQLYPEFGDDFKRLKCFRTYIPHLTEETQRFMAEKDGWDDFVDSNFLAFDALEVLNDYLFCGETAETTNKLLEVMDNSREFYKYVAENEIDVNDLPSNLPFITEDGKIVEGFDWRVYFFNNEGYNLSKETWLPDDFVQILSHEYFNEPAVDAALKTTFEDFGVKDYSDDGFIKDVIVGDDDARSDINYKLDEDLDASKAFVRYLFDHRDTLKEKDNQLGQYVLCCNDINGEEYYLCDDDVRYFNQEAYENNSCFADNCEYDWLDDTMMYCLSPAYLQSFEETDRKAAESFLRQSFGIKTFTDKSFFKEVILGHKKAIFENLKDRATTSSFVDYLHDHSSIIFDGSLSYNDLKDMPLILHSGSVQKERLDGTEIYEFNEEAKYVLGRKWCPEEIFTLLDPIYTEKLGKDALQLLKIGQFSLSAFVTGTLVKDTSFTSLMDVNDYNIDFWRWIKSHLKEIESFDELQQIHLIDNKLQTDHTGEELYIADKYQANGIEALVKKYDEEALFVSEKYLEEETEQCKNEWLKLFKKLNLKSDNKDILFNSILPNLASFEDDAVVAMLTKHLKDLTSSWDSVLDQLQKLRVRTRGGSYLSLEECVVVNIEGEKEEAEPFNYITINDEVAPEIVKANSEIILKIADTFEDNLIITDRVAWAREKIESYINSIQDNEVERDRIHVQFIKELANLNKAYSFDSGIISKVYFKTKVGEYLSASEITLGSVYKPRCDFESNGITTLKYLTESYITEDNKDLLEDLFRDKTEIHRRFEEEDIPLLETRQFAVYYWSRIFPRGRTDYQDWIEEGLFDEVRCIPTASSVKKPTEIYSPEILHYVQHTPGWTEKLPANEVVNKIQDEDDREAFYSLPFKKEMGFQDCLYYLLNAKEKYSEESDYRRQVVEWILDADDIDESAVATYRKQPTAKWRNGKGRPSHISELYVIHPAASQEKAIFSGDEHVMNTKMFPDDEDEFLRFCEIMQIQVLTSKDFVTTPINDREETARILQTINKKLLILAAIENSDKYGSLYDKYITTIKEYRFFVCDKIDLGYDKIHNDVERTYLDGNNLYYVNSWTNNRTYTKFCSRVKRILGLNVLDDICEDVLDESVSVEECLDKYCPSLAYDASFKKFISDLQIVLAVPEEEEPEETENEYYTGTLSKVQNEEPETDDVGDVEIVDVSPEREDEEEYTSQGGSSYTPSARSYEPSRPEAPKASTPKPQSEPQEKKETATPHEPANKEPRQPATHSSERDTEYQPRRSSGTSRVREYSMPKPFSPEDVEHFKSRGETRCLSTAPADPGELDRVNRLLGVDMSAEEVADTNYLSQLRMYDWLKRHNFEPEESEADFVRSDRVEQRLKGGKYIHKCSAAGGVLYISPSIWNKVADDKCVVLVYLGAKSKDFMYLKDTQDLLTWIGEDDILIKLTGEDRVDVVNTLYGGVLEGVTGTAYTLIRVASLGEPDLLFVPVQEDPGQEENLDEY